MNGERKFEGRNQREENNTPKMKTKIRKEFLKEKHNQGGIISGKKIAKKFANRAGFWIGKRAGRAEFFVE